MSPLKSLEPLLPHCWQGYGNISTHWAIEPSGPFAKSITQPTDS